MSTGRVVRILIVFVIGILSGRSLIAEMFVLPKPHRIFDKQQTQWAAYTLEESKQILKFDRELFYLRDQFKFQESTILTLSEMLRTSKELNSHLERAFQFEIENITDLRTELISVTKEKNHYKHRARFSIGGLKLGGAGLGGLLLGLALGIFVIN